jgi:hypothetical protein
MKKFLAVTMSCCLLGFGVSAHADSVAESWLCELKDGKTVEDVQAINSKWLKWVNARVENAVVRSAVGTAIVGNSEIFMFVDTYPDLTTWAAVKTLLDGEEGDEIEGMFNETSECSSNRLWNMQETK